MSTSSTIVSKFSFHLRCVLERALGLARQWGNGIVEPEFFLIALLREPGSVAAEVLGKHRLSPELVDEWMQRTHIQTLPAPQDAAPASARLSEDAKQILEKSVHSANQLQHKYIGTEHLLSAVLQWIEGNAAASVTNFLKEQSVNVRELRGDLSAVMKTTSKFPDIAETMTLLRDGMHEHHHHDEEVDEETTPALDFFATELTSSALAAQLDPMVGREQEVERVIQVLLRRTKNNPVLLGEAGVGKTAIVEGLAKRIVDGDVPELLQQMKIYALDMSILVSGSIFRGEFEGRLRQVLDEIRRNDDIILFIDELHTIMGAGAGSGALDAANILKPALARGEIRCIGATTFDEYKKYIEKDAALGRRFQAVTVSEPTAEQTIAMMKGIRKNYEQFHRIRVTDTAIEEAVRLSQRYLPDRTFPDKAIDIIDEALSHARLHLPMDPLIKRLRSAQESLEKIQKEKQDAVATEQFEIALEKRAQEEALREIVQYCNEALSKKQKTITQTITPEDIERVVATITGIPLADLSVDHGKALQQLESTLNESIIGQEEAVAAVASTIRRAHTRFGSRTRPLGSFLFVGPSGVGKTELAKTVATTLFGHTPEGGIIRIDMSEFSEAFTVSKLIGAPAGYVGYRESGKLTDQVRARPHSVILFDELEKAHPDVYHLLLQVLDDGRLTDGSGRTVYFHESIIIMTTNVGSDSILRRGIEGFSAQPDGLGGDITMSPFESALKQFFRVEFLNRIDSTVFFRPLSMESLEGIVDKELRLLNQQLAHKGVTVTIDAPTRTFLASHNNRIELGARNIRRNMQQWIETPLADAMIAGPLSSAISVILHNGRPAITLPSSSRILRHQSASVRVHDRIHDTTLIA